MHKSHISITQENVNGKFDMIEGHVYFTECDTLINAKSSIIDVIWESIELDGLIGRCMIDVSIENDDYDFIDYDNFIIKIDKVVRTDTPSKFIQWGNKSPHIFTVDREHSVVVYEDTGLRLK